MIGILLAAGFSRRFGAADKLLQTLPNGQIMALAAANNLLTAFPLSVAVVRADNLALADALRQLGMQVVTCAEEATVMADSLVTALRYAQQLKLHHEGVVIALADMPYIKPQTMRQVAHALKAGGGIVVPTYLGQRGHPVAFAAKFVPALLTLQGDYGAREILKQHVDEVSLLPCDDAGIVADIDTPADINQLAERAKPVSD